MRSANVVIEQPDIAASDLKRRRTVAEDPLEGEDVAAVRQKSPREAVPQDVRGASVCDPRRAGESPNELLNGSSRQGDAPTSNEQWRGKRCGENLVASLEGEDPGGELLERGGIGRGEDLALEDAEVDLDLVEPAGVDREMDGHEPWVRFGETRDGGPAVMRAAVIEQTCHRPRLARRALCARESAP